MEINDNLNYPKFSVCMLVYKNDNPTDFADAVYSVHHQTCPPDEIVVVVDGPIPNALQLRICELKSEVSILNVIYLAQNKGHSIARQTGLNIVKNEFVALMDADDLSVPNRFEKQLRAFDKHPEVSVVGGLINEFVRSPENVVGTRIVPETDCDIKEYLQSRCPMNQVSVMLKKSDVMKVGGYQDWYCNEDYYLWIRLTLKGYKFYNIQENLVNVRVGEEMYQRRGGVRYFKSEASLQKYMWKNNIISLPKYLYNVAIRFAVQVAMPNRLRGWVFQTFARE